MHENLGSPLTLSIYVCRDKASGYRGEYHISALRFHAWCMPLSLAGKLLLIL